MRLRAVRVPAGQTAPHPGFGSTATFTVDTRVGRIQYDDTVDVRRLMAWTDRLEARGQADV